MKEWNANDPFDKGKVLYKGDCGLTCLHIRPSNPTSLIIGLENGSILEIDRKNFAEPRKIFQAEGGIQALDVNEKGDIALATDAKSYFIVEGQTNKPLKKEDCKEFVSDIRFFGEGNGILVSKYDKTIEFQSSV